MGAPGRFGTVEAPPIEKVMDQPLDELLARLAGGDKAAAGQLFLAFEPYLRKAIRRHLPRPLRAKFDSGDVLQSVWADLLRRFTAAGGRFANADQLRAFLYVAARNRLIDRIRQFRDAAAREQPLGAGEPEHVPPSPQPRPSQVVQAEDLWQHILARCPSEHRPILTLKRQGFSLAEIGARTGLHPDSVRRILRLLARRLAFAPGEDEE
jgi:RNA polymerase sigma factor (sigma-70 family)